MKKEPKIFFVLGAFAAQGKTHNQKFNIAYFYAIQQIKFGLYEFTV